MRILVALWVLAAYAQSPNILGRVDVQKGESRRNENIFITANGCYSVLLERIKRKLELHRKLLGHCPTRFRWFYYLQKG